MRLSDAQLADANDAFEREVVAWVVTPDRSSEWNDRGRTRYRFSWLDDSKRELGGRDPAQASFMQQRVETEFAYRFIRLRAIAAAFRTL